MPVEDISFSVSPPINGLFLRIGVIFNSPFPLLCKVLLVLPHACVQRVFVPPDVTSYVNTTHIAGT